jgi:hypothetical protein
MRRWVWTNGRLAWPLVVAIVFLTATVLSFDLTWRLLVLPFSLLATGALLIYSLVLICVIAIGFRMGHRRASALVDRL